MAVCGLVSAMWEARGDEALLGRDPTLTTALASPTGNPRNTNFAHVALGATGYFPVVDILNLS